MSVEIAWLSACVIICSTVAICFSVKTYLDYQRWRVQFVRDRLLYEDRYTAKAGP